jgi:hypothetical protein
MNNWPSAQDTLPRLKWQDMSGYGYQTSVVKTTFGLKTGEAKATLIKLGNGTYLASIETKNINLFEDCKNLAQAKRWARQALKENF